MNKIFKSRILTGKVCLIGIALLVLSPLCYAKKMNCHTTTPTAFSQKMAGEGLNLNGANSCNKVTSSKPDVQTIEYAILRDVSRSSETIAFDADFIFRKVLTELDLKGSKNGVNFRTALCGSSRIPEIRLASLPAQDSWFASSSERTQHLRQFLVATKENVEHLASKKRDQSQTNLYRSIVHLVQQIESSSSEKRIWIYSDLVNCSSAFNANSYSEAPSKVMTDYDAIVKNLEADIPLPDMTGIEFILVTPGNTDLLLWMSRFFQKLLESKNAKVQIRGSF